MSGDVLAPFDSYTYNSVSKPARKRGGFMLLRAICLALLSVTSVIAAQDSYDYRVLATTKTSTMEKELNEAADAGFRFDHAMGGKSTFGGSEVVSIMVKTR